MPRRRHHEQLFAEHRQRHEIGFLDRQRQQPDVDAARPDLLHRSIGRRYAQADVQLRVHAAQLLQERREDVEAHRHAAREAQRPAQLARPIGDGADRFAHVLEHALSELHETLGRRRHPHLPADAQEQRLAELRLEQENLPADGRLRHV